MSTTSEGPVQQDWPRPPGCACATWRQHEVCYENCDPVEPKVKRRLWPVGLAAVLAVIVALVHLFLISPARSADLNLGDPYECFGAGRYAAMEQGLTCSKRAAWRLPNYCDGLKLMERSCTSVKAIAKVYGRSGAERRARVCGATDADIVEAAKCFEDKK